MKYTLSYIDFEAKMYKGRLFDRVAIRYVHDSIEQNEHTSRFVDALFTATNNQEPIRTNAHTFAAEYWFSSLMIEP